MTSYLYRKSTCRAIPAVLAIFLAVTTGSAQSRQPRQPQAQPTTPSTASSTTSTAKKSKRGPRAIAVVEFLPDGGMRLVPIALWIDGKYYDASLYGANPEPMAVEPETVYEAQSLGEPTGTFTVTEPRQVNGSWIADGSWRPHLALDEQLAAKAAKDAANKPKANPDKTVFSGETDDSRPVLKRAPGSGADSGSTTQPSQSTTASDPDRPTMKRPAGDSSSNPAASSSGGSTSTTSSQTPVDDNDPNRPVMKRSSPASTSPAPSGSSDSGSMPMTQAAATSNDNDPNRPVLSHNRTAKPQITSDAVSAKNDAPYTAGMKGAKAYPAISDASDYRGRPLLYSMSPGERQTQEQQALKLAMDEIRAFAAKHTGPAIPKTAAITDYDVRAFDLDYSSSPTIVLTAKLPVAPSVAPPAKVPAAKGPAAKAPPTKTSPAGDFTYYVTIVAKVDINDQPQKIFSSVTDTRHLDAYPRMELIDALDADANGRGDLLFRRYSDTGISYGLYRVSPYQIEKIFEGGSSL